ncbi:OTU domain-containing protein 6B [Ceratitis capitata]|uniref:ubiquitinyl hydrolase 1 n=1 Tax=Ceratitis capitata TaxID=7213 RepID=W8BNQ3_CERCA|nr:OTU domain-containing protein 6B [Ceratitis capitata]XP_004535021.1 OTU domain-containing protein 6B [Ceratitis capitata]
MSITNTESELSVALSGIELEDLLSRHRRERKDLQAKIQALKKNAPKNDKKKRKEAMEEVARMEIDLEKKQAAEVAALEAQKKQREQNQTPNAQNTAADDTLCNGGDEQNTGNATQRVTKAQKRRDKKAREALEREEDIRAAAEDAKYAPKAVEGRTIQTKLLERQLALHNIPSDGDCLYNAVRHQLSQNGLTAHSVQELRKETANYIRAHKDTLICYMTNPKTGELLTEAEFEQYCNSVQKTPAWGGQIELKALSSILKVPIEVLQAEGPPTVQGADEFSGPNLIITYHRHMYSLGEHYNSTVLIEKQHA